MASTLLERLALRHIRVPTAATLASQNSSGSATSSATASAPTPLTATVRKTLIPTFDAVRVEAKPVQKLRVAPVASDDGAAPAAKEPMRRLSHPLKSTQLRKKKQEVSEAAFAVAAPELGSKKRGRPRHRGVPGAAPVDASSTANNEHAPSRGVDAMQAFAEAAGVAMASNQRLLPSSPPLRKCNEKRKRKQLSETSPLVVQTQSQASQLQDRSQARSPDRLQQRKTAKKGKRSGSPQPRLLATPQRRASSSPQGKALANTASPISLSFNSGSETCMICCEDVGASDAVRLRCRHGWYCKECVSRHVEARLDTGAVQQTCPECNVELVERDLKRLISPELMERLLARSLEQAVAATENLRPCPTPNCPMRVALDEDETGQFLCTECKKSSCLRCGAQPYHRRMTCEQYAARNNQSKRDSFMQWMEETGAKQCPSCRMAVTKQDIKHQGTERSECHKMLCRNCNTRFCFNCLAVLTDTYTCGCTKDKHGFVDPRSGKYVAHLKKRRQRVPSSGGDNNVSSDRRDSRHRAAGA